MASRPGSQARTSSAPVADHRRSQPSGNKGTFHARLTPHHGDAQVDVAIHYAWHGRAGAPTVIVQGGISAHRNPCAQDGNPGTGWWEPICGQGAAIDTQRYRVLAIDYVFGDAFAAAGAVSTVDQADALALLLSYLGIARVAGFVGASYGAMVGLAFAARHPLRIARLVAISGAHRAHPMAIAWRGIQRRIVALGARHGAATEALAIARELAMTTYRTEEEFGQRFATEPERRSAGFHFPVDDYLVAAGARFAATCAVDRFLQLSASLDLHHVDPAQIAVPTTLVAIRSDRLVPLEDVRALAAAVSGPVDLVEIESLYGHDAFLKETAAITQILRTAFSTGDAP